MAVAFGQLIRKPLLRLAPRGVLNLHPSLLPRHRGASPIQTAILCGDVETGVTIMAMDRGLDTGPTFSRRATPIHLDETTPGLEAAGSPNWEPIYWSKHWTLSRSGGCGPSRRTKRSRR